MKNINYHQCSIAILLTLTFFVITLFPVYSTADEQKNIKDATHKQLNIYDKLIKTNIPEEYVEDVKSSNDPQREEVFITNDDGIIYVGTYGWSVVFILLNDELNIKDVKYIRAKGGFSVSWYNGLVITIHNHPGTDMFYHEPKHVTSKNNKLIIEDAAVDWPARHADN